jgi:hypothetical protein
MKAPADLSAFSFVPPEAVSGSWALASVLVLFVFVAGGGAAYLLATASWLRARARRESAELLGRSRTSLVAGAPRVVAGVVAAEASGAVPVSTVITQAVVDRTDRGLRSHHWRESAREIGATPFFLERPDGEAIYVVPDLDVLLVAPLETSYPDAWRRERARIASVRAGSELLACGELTRAPTVGPSAGYRDGRGWVLRPPRQGRMVLASPAALRERYTRRIRVLFACGAGAAIVCGLLNAFVAAPVVLAALFGRTSLAAVTGARTYTTRDRHGDHKHYAITVRTPFGTSLSSEVQSAAYFAASSSRLRGEEVVVPVLRVPGWNRATFLGTTPYVTTLWLVFGVVLPVAGALVFRRAYEGAAPWYDRNKLNEPGGRGHWRETRPVLPVDPSAN